jgi:hypothetical protein
MRPKVVTTLVAFVVAGVALQWLGRVYGSTGDERRRQLPGDELVQAPQVITNHAKTIRAPAASVWPWLVQMGWGRGQWVHGQVGRQSSCFRATDRVRTRSCRNFRTSPSGTGCWMVHPRPTAVSQWKGLRRTGTWSCTRESISRTAGAGAEQVSTSPAYSSSMTSGTGGAGCSSAADHAFGRGGSRPSTSRR